MTKPAYSIDAEQALLGAILNDSTQFVACNVSESDFYTGKHRASWAAMSTLHARREPLDAVSVAEQLEREGRLGTAGGLEYLANLARETAAPNNAPHYAKIVHQHAQTRAAQKIGQRLAQLEDVADLEGNIRDLIALTQTARNHSCTLSEAMDDAFDALAGESTAATSTGIRDLDDALGGFRSSDLIIVGARPAMGKTAFLLNLALASKVPVGIISGEQGREQIGMRCIAIDGQVSLHHMRTRKVDDASWVRITAAMNAAKDRRIFINDRPAPSIDDIVRQARAWKFERGIGVLMVDYLQKIQGGAGDSMRERIGSIASRLKDLARELEIPVAVMAQCKREVESRPMDQDGMGRMPGMADIAESSIIEQEADQILTLYRPKVYSDLPQFDGLAIVNICKNRHGPIGFKRISWRGEFLQFSDLAEDMP